ncbi:MAG: 2-C-methyl-D-erythritol 4-phosphate cytidylyltransferase, partial [Planctomycetota bacterium]
VRTEARGRTPLADTPDRRGLGATQSPQGARRGLLVAALAAAREGGWEAADEVELLLRAGTEVTAVRGHPHNIRITVPADLDLAEGLLIEAPPD